MARKNIKVKTKKPQRKIQKYLDIRWVLLFIIVILVSYIYFHNSDIDYQPNIEPIPTESNSNTTASKQDNVLPKLPQITLSKEQKDCPSGFYYYENDSYSLCYPSNMSAQQQTDKESLGLDVPDIVEFYNESESIFVSPGPWGPSGWSKNPCDEERNVTIDLQKATEYYFHISAPTCGNIKEILTRFKDNNYVLYMVPKEGKSIQETDYATLKNSLHIKKTYKY